MHEEGVEINAEWSAGSQDRLSDWILGRNCENRLQARGSLCDARVWGGDRIAFPARSPEMLKGRVRVRIRSSGRQTCYTGHSGTP